MPLKARHLITTAEKSSWESDKPALVINDLCSQEEVRRFFGNADVIILPRLKTQKELRGDYVYLTDLYERTLAQLSENLNSIHCKDYSIRYWRILIGPWLAFFIHILYSRWYDVVSVLEKFNIVSSTILEFENSEMVPNDMGEFVECFVSDRWNHFIYGAILQNFPEVSLVRKSIDTVSEPKKSKKKSSVKFLLAELYSKFSSKFLSDKDCVLMGTHLKTIDDFKIQLLLWQMPQIYLPIQSPKFPAIDTIARNLLPQKSLHNTFEDVLYKMISQQIPKAYVEGYALLNSYANELGWPSQPKAIFTSNSLFYNTVNMAYVAEKVSNGASLVYGQHGGTYGVSEFSWYEDHEIKISDKYLTWGWGSDYESKIRPVGIFNPPKLRRGGSNSKIDLLFVAYTVPRYLFITWSESLLMGKKYINDSFLFANTLSNEVLPHLIVRLHNYDYGWKQAEQWMESFPSLIVDCGEQPMSNLLNKSRIVVCTYNGAGLLEALSANIPVIFYWDPELSTLRESAVGYYDELREVGIFHHSPSSAAEHINANWHDIDAWWNSIQVQAAIMRFSANYCKVNKNLLREIYDAMQDK
jgi:putative transferase (TIGR04331 family)